MPAQPLVGGLLAVGTCGATWGEGEALPTALCQKPGPRSKPRASGSAALPAHVPPAQAGMSHPALGTRGQRGSTDGVPAGLAGLGKEALEAAAAAGPAARHHVALPAQGHVTLQAAEVLQVPAPALRLDALLHEDQLQGEKQPVLSSSKHPARKPIAWRTLCCEEERGGAPVPWQGHRALQGSEGTFLLPTTALAAFAAPSQAQEL